jgi:hypothetical protein
MHTGPPSRDLLHFFVRGLLAAGVAKLLSLQPLGVLFLVFRSCVVAVLTVPALQRNDFPHASMPSSAKIFWLELLFFKAF